MSFLSLVKGTIEIKDVIKWNLKSRIRGEVPTKPYKMGKKIVILGNGPSQKLFWANKKNFDDYDILTMNSFPYRAKKEFFEIKPKYYCAIDPVLFDRERAEKAGYILDYEEIREVFENVNWEIYLITWAENEFNIKNDYVTEIKLSRCVIESLPFFLRKTLYLKNMATMIAESVATPSILFAVIFGYQTVALFGVDHDDCIAIMIDEKNNISGETWHSYDDVKPDITKIRDENGHHIYEIFEGYRDLFKTYLNVEQLAGSVGCRIINYNSKSYVDAFEKSVKYNK